MLEIQKEDIYLFQKANTKEEAIRSIATSLFQKGYVTKDYVFGMLQREDQSTTFLGSAIAIPHGTTKTRSLVQKTGIVLHHFENGVDWGDKNIVYLAIGIAAKSDEHLSILTELTKVLGTDKIEEKLQNISKAQDLIEIIKGKSDEICFTKELINLNFQASSIAPINAFGLGLLKQNKAIDNNFIGQILENQPTYLGQGLWLNSSNIGVLKNTISLVCIKEPFEFQKKKMQGLVLIASKSKVHLYFLERLKDLIINKKQDLLFNSTKEIILNLLTKKDNKNKEVEDKDKNSAKKTIEKTKENEEIFQIKNPHGLHVRPAATLVNTTKKFSSTIEVSNLDGTKEYVDAKNIMAVVSLEVKYNHRLKFSANGDDAKTALKEISSVINQGLGEKN